MLTQVGIKAPKISFNFLRFFTDAKKIDDDNLFRKVDEMIEKEIKPILQADGGDIYLHDIKDGCMVVELHGACSSCPSKNSTLYNGVLGAVNERFPEIVDIRQKLDFEDFD